MYTYTHIKNVKFSVLISWHYVNIFALMFKRIFVGIEYVFGFFLSLLNLKWNCLKNNIHFKDIFGNNTEKRFVYVHLLEPTLNFHYNPICLTDWNFAKRRYEDKLNTV